MLKLSQIVAGAVAVTLAGAIPTTASASSFTDREVLQASEEGETVVLSVREVQVDFVDPATGRTLYVPAVERKLLDLPEQNRATNSTLGPEPVRGCERTIVEAVPYQSGTRVLAYAEQSWGDACYAEFRPMSVSIYSKRALGATVQEAVNSQRPPNPPRNSFVSVTTVFNCAGTRTFYATTNSGQSADSISTSPDRVLC